MKESTLLLERLYRDFEVFSSFETMFGHIVRGPVTVEIEGVAEGHETLQLVGLT